MNARKAKAIREEAETYTIGQSPAHTKRFAKKIKKHIKAHAGKVGKTEKRTTGYFCCRKAR